MTASISGEFPVACVTNEDKLAFAYRRRWLLMEEFNEKAPILKKESEENFLEWKRTDWLLRDKFQGLQIDKILSTMDLKGTEINPFEYSEKEIQTFLDTRKDIKTVGFQDSSWDTFIDLEAIEKIGNVDLRMDPQQNFTSWTIVNPFSPATPITATSTTATADQWDARYNGTTYSGIYRDFGSGFFDGSFEHLVDVYGDTTYSTYTTGVHWAMTNDLNHVKTLVDTNKNGYILMQNLYAGIIGIYQFIGYGYNGDISSGDPDGVQFYAEVERDETVGSYGDLEARLYTNSERTILWEPALNVTLNTGKYDYRYLFAFLSIGNNASTTYDYYGTTANLDTQVADPVTTNIPAIVNHLKQQGIA